MDTPVPLPARNRSLAAGKTDPDLPNRSFRPRLRSLRWVSEPLDQPEAYALGPGQQGKPPIRPDLPSRLGVHIRDRAWQRVAHNLGVFKEPAVVLSLVSDRAAQYVREFQPGLYFAVWIVTSRLEKAVASFSFETSASQPEISTGDKAIQDQELQAGDFRPLVFIEDGAIQGLSLRGQEHRPEVNLTEQAQQTTSSAAGTHTPEVNLSDKAQQLSALSNGDFRPLVFLDERASQMLETVNGEHFLVFQIQSLLEKVVQEIVSGEGAHDVPIFEITVSDKGIMSVVTTTGLHDLFYRSSDDNFETYTFGVDLATLNDGTNWDAGYVSRGEDVPTSDDLESYSLSVGLDLDGLNGGIAWSSVYTSRNNDLWLVSDNFEAYTIGVELDTLNAGTNWDAAYVGRSNPELIKDNFESYSNGADLAGLNAGTLWNGAYISNGFALPSFDNFEAYSDTANLNGLNNGTNWNGAYVSR